MQTPLQTTKIGHIAAAFRKDKCIDGRKDIYLVFDGDRLDADDTIGDTDIGDQDRIDVTLK